MATNRERMLTAAVRVPAPPPGGGFPPGLVVTPPTRVPAPQPTPSPKANPSPKPDPNYVPPNPLNVIPGYEGLGQITATVADLGRWIGSPRNWVRILEVFGGTILCVVALFLMAKSGAGPVADGMNSAVNIPVKVVKTVGKVVP